MYVNLNAGKLINEFDHSYIPGNSNVHNQRFIRHFSFEIDSNSSSKWEYKLKKYYFSVFCMIIISIKRCQTSLIVEYQKQS